MGENDMNQRKQPAKMKNPGRNSKIEEVFAQNSEKDVKKKEVMGEMMLRAQKFAHWIWKCTDYSVLRIFLNRAESQCEK